ncbi:hypothetical protein PVAND_004966 [Polypedilum vanderplanki]|uniref:Glycine rich protein n=1 Tax=Polypedilum vanderplanki TaxID=319348 RepID=A0A9J6BZN4_POLVA|nr:hypothetical protein PVAND_004966 [Polypedilum vanderplanki]
MGIYTKVFILLAILGVISSLPIEPETNESQVDLLAVESLPDQDSLSNNEGTEQLTRDKRHHRHYGGWGRYGYGYGGGWGYPYARWGPSYYGGWGKFS